MGEVNNVLAVTLVVMTAGSALYTIKTYMQPGMKIAINLAEIKEEFNEDSFEPLRQSSRYTKFTTMPSTSLYTETTTSFTTTKRNNKKKTRPTIPVIMKELPGSKTSDNEFNNNNNNNEREIEGPPIKKRSIIETRLGDIEGIEQDVSGKNVLAFLGVHYAMPPTGELRFKKPKPIEPWNGIKSAKVYGSPCMQYLPNATDLPITLLRKDFSEDCLHLNIWTPSLKRPLKPVLIFIHGGSFSFGSNSVDETDGRVLAAMENVVVVTINYRLGPFGFMNAKIEETPGNMGLHDMITAIKWIKSNIRAFGGDHNMITLMGHSSGAIATTIFLTHPAYKNLFKRAILQSGTATVFNFYFERSFQSSENFAEMLGCSDQTRNLTNNPELVMKCIREMPLQRLKRATEDQLSEELYSYSPAIGEEMMPQFPKDSVEDSKLFGDQKEILIGTNSDEGALFFHLGNPDIFKRDKAPTIKDIEEAKDLLASSLKDWGLSKSTLKLMNSFFLEKTKSVEPKVILKAMHDVFGDLAFTCPAVYFSEKFAEKNRTSYYYFYTHQTQSVNKSDWMGATHFDEVPFVFGYPLRYPHKYSGIDIDFSKRIMNIWATFARTGKPPALNGIEWPQYNAENQEFVELNGKYGKVGIGVGPHKDNCDTWKYAFRLFN